MMRKMLAGSTSQMFPIKIYDSSSTTGAGLSGLAYNSAGLVAKYRRAGDSSWTTITLASGTLGTYSSGGFVSDGGVAGGYEIGPPNAALAPGVPWVHVQLYGATNMLAVDLFIELDAVNYQDAVRMGLTALPNANASASGGLLTFGTSTGQVNPSSGIVPCDLQTIKTQTVTCAAGVTVLASVGTASTSTAQTGDAYARIGANGAALTAIGDTRMANLDAAVSSRMATYTQPTGFLAATFPATVASTTNITGGTITTVTNLTNAPTSGDLTATMKASVTTAATAATPVAASVTGNVGGNVTGSVGSVVGAVGSVTGNVGGNVVGSVGSVTGLTNATIATAVWTDTTAGDFATASSPGKILVSQLGGAFTTTSSSVYSTASLANAPSGGGGSGPTASQIATAVWQDLTSGSDFTTVGSIGKLLATDIDATISSRSTYAGGAVASVTAPVTVGTNSDKTGYSLTQSFPTNFSSLSIDSSGFVKLSGTPKKNTALAGFQFYMVLSSDHSSPATGKTITATRSLDGAAFSACANSATELGLGWYSIDLAAGDMNANSVAIQFAADACDATTYNILTTP